MYTATFIAILTLSLSVLTFATPVSIDVGASGDALLALNLDIR
jgi:hypothetical protein